MSVPNSRLGDEVGWTTVYYYSRHEDIRRDIWRYQWRLRLRLEKGKNDRYLDQQRRVNLDRHKRKVAHEDEMWKRVDEEKWRLDVPKEKRQRRQKLLDSYNQELELIKEDQSNDRHKEKERFRIEFHRQQALVREQRREKRQQERVSLLREDESGDKEERIKRRGRAAFHTQQREIQMDSIRRGIDRRREEREERIDRRKRERAEGPSYDRYAPGERQHKQRIRDINEESGKERELREKAFYASAREGLEPVAPRRSKYVAVARLVPVMDGEEILPPPSSSSSASSSDVVATNEAVVPVMSDNGGTPLDPSPPEATAEERSSESTSASPSPSPPAAAAALAVAAPPSAAGVSEPEVNSPTPVASLAAMIADNSTPATSEGDDSTTAQAGVGDAVTLPEERSPAPPEEIVSTPTEEFSSFAPPEEVATVPPEEKSAEIALVPDASS